MRDSDPFIARPARTAPTIAAQPRPKPLFKPANFVPFALNELPVRLRNRSTFDFVHKLLRRLAKSAQ
jgi:hypothetical protein